LVNGENQRHFNLFAAGCGSFLRASCLLELVGPLEEAGNLGALQVAHGGGGARLGHALGPGGAKGVGAGRGQLCEGALLGRQNGAQVCESVSQKSALCEFVWGVGEAWSFIGIRQISSVKFGMRV